MSNHPVSSRNSPADRRAVHKNGRAWGVVIVAILLFTTSALVAGSKNDAEPEGLLQRIRETISNRLSHLPNYTCHEVVDRLFRSSNSGELRHLDKLEFEVAFVDNTELFAKTGAARFESASLSTIVGGGTIGSGAFASHAGALFWGNIATFRYAGLGKKAGHKTYRYDYEVPVEKSHFLLKHGSAEGIVAYKGSFWADSETLDLVRLELKVDHIPAFMGVSSVFEWMGYTIVQIRGSEFLIPEKSEMTAFDESGNYSLNIIKFADCREFKGESLVKYGSPGSTNSADRQAEPEP